VGTELFPFFQDSHREVLAAFLGQVHQAVSQGQVGRATTYQDDIILDTIL
jgi:hypothetical protein